MSDCDVAVVGSGLVGMAAALALDEAGLDVVLVGAEPPPSPPSGWDSRIYALSPGARDWLHHLGVWSALPAGRVQPVHAMQVSGDGAGRLQFDAVETGVEALSWIIEGSALGAALHQTLQRRASVHVRIPERPRAWQLEPAWSGLQLSGGDCLRARLLVGADGAESWLRRAAGIGQSVRSYPQMAVVANFQASQGHGGVARQWFREDGVLALLPLPGDGLSMVWSAVEATAEALMRADEASLCERVEAAGGMSRGDLRLVTPPRAFPLRLRRCATVVGPRLVLVGDAAHTVHPLAGQGLNLGLRDVRGLAEIMAARGPEPDCGSPSLLRRHERARAEDVLATVAVTDGLQRLFGTSLPGLQPLRNLGLSLVDRIAPLRLALARRALA